MGATSAGWICRWSRDNSSDTLVEFGNDTTDNLAKREPGVVGYKIMQTQVVKTWDWWSPWYPASSWLWNELNSKDSSMTFNWGCTYTWSTSVGPIGWGSISSIIGVGWSESITLGNSTQCRIPANEVAQVWYQTIVKSGYAQYRYVPNYQDSSNGRLGVKSTSKFSIPRDVVPGDGFHSNGCSACRDNVDCDFLLDWKRQWWCYLISLNISTRDKKKEESL